MIYFFVFKFVFAFKMFYIATFVSAQSLVITQE